VFGQQEKGEGKESVFYFLFNLVSKVRFSLKSCVFHCVFKIITFIKT
jgi:hypothetical protein